ncbi:hypothetical protein [Mesorhizobium sp.]|uniref:hypothetical protein n=1 Tax=Mesorhizobium sp. TaxID=1871066 RepID=UPI000FE61DA0|nr:hypothetical protein [Mesorhizobium sp.]RWN58455.1 MAG: hypothetical protein EOS00_21225 [Mesorhizobium sp.]
MVDTVGMRSDDLHALLAEVSRELVRISIEDRQGVISLPQTYPGGSAVVVRMRPDGEDYIVTDNGLGFVEADHLGGSAIYARIAPATAKVHGVRYDGDMMFAAQVPRDWLANAIVFVSSASRRAVEATAQKLAEERDNETRARFRARLAEAFPGEAAFGVPFVGRSTKEWHFEAIVRLKGHAALFDLVTPNHVSVASSIVKFQDVVRLEDGPRGIAVLVDRKHMDAADITMISEAASSVVTLDASASALRKAA